MQTQIATNNATQLSPLEVQAAPSTTLHSWATTQDGREGRHLEEIRDLLRAQRDLEDPQDYERSPSTAVLKLNYGRAHRMQLLFAEGMGEPMGLSRHALRQLAERTLPSRGLGFMDKLISLRMRNQAGELDEAGAKLATMTWALFNQTRKQPLTFRTVKRGPFRQVRAVLSQGYAVYDNLQFIEDTLAALGSQADLYRAIDWRIDDDAMRVRLVGGGNGGLETWQSRAVDKPIPMVELWDSEVGKRAVYVKSGTYTLWCSNGCGHWSDDGVWRWNHTGRTSERIREGVASAIAEAAVKGSGIVEAYNQALNTSINDAFLWFEQQVGNDVTETQKESVRNTMLNNPTVHGEGKLLASVVDAVTWVAHEQADLFEQERLERMGGRLLQRGLGQSEGGRIRVALPIAEAK